MERPKFLFVKTEDLHEIRVKGKLKPVEKISGVR
jgi:hypothetical protein